MKTLFTTQYTTLYQFLIAITCAVLGYNLYQEIVHPENSRLTLSIILVVLTYYTAQKYGQKIEKKF
ncbi:hypothetical protein NAL32_15815 [Chryseobacterium sp. Ch-15]|uniref:Uncharacterized protein n=1 Tax=Chryseobacterium muglaense TaxID=2893752 RepID=A0A9Q3YRV5_9FLAO|nr:hypothetical protein [Chryseobacterium muglaense]MBD3906052.1 hypothetical protein [Chryseobacterium muglaense]MCC9035214.1 hypothetical protein [Chryseobacterium muglaense]MCM2555851.1 hypothetical protein [Chryseobacterium muglaense]